jgi:hypothetical protein
MSPARLRDVAVLDAFLYDPPLLFGSSIYARSSVHGASCFGGPDSTWMRWPALAGSVAIRTRLRVSAPPRYLNRIVQSRHMRRVLTLAILLMSYGRLAVLAQNSLPSAGQLSAKEVLDKHVAATGSVEAWHALQTVDAYGSFHYGAFNSFGDFHFYYRAPESDAFQLDMISHGQTSVGHNGETPFSRHVGEETRAMNGVTLLSLEQSWIALTESELGQRYARIDLLGSSKINGKCAYALQFTPKVGDAQVRYYDCQSFLMIRMDSTQRMPLQKDSPELVYKVQTDFSAYRDFGGIKFPRQINATASAGDLVLDIHEVHTNRPVNDSVFREK